MFLIQFRWFKLHRICTLFAEEFSLNNSWISHPAITKYLRCLTQFVCVPSCDCRRWNRIHGTTQRWFPSLDTSIMLLWLKWPTSSEAVNSIPLLWQENDVRQLGNSEMWTGTGISEILYGLSLLRLWVMRRHIVLITIQRSNDRHLHI